MIEGLGPNPGVFPLDFGPVRADYGNPAVDVVVVLAAIGGFLIIKKLVDRLL